MAQKAKKLPQDKYDRENKNQRRTTGTRSGRVSEPRYVQGRKYVNVSINIPASIYLHGAAEADRYEVTKTAVFKKWITLGYEEDCKK